jgi:hypothetical protein
MHDTFQFTPINTKFRRNPLCCFRMKHTGSIHFVQRRRTNFIDKLYTEIYNTGAKNVT